ncbi:hypothetical protein EV356DRAFT_512920 [Viridothelium virens]|uniref:Uncharacterized protein n=1 Tax=Viridothelium virens TaxID=1048519 RepID=A0A6A6GS32_VIRVR|nr:hypothetical protein EV356DRAFT_512920 [Viridothelium virens]
MGGRKTEVTPYIQNTYNSNYAPAEFINFGDNITATIGKHKCQSQTDIKRNERSGYDEEADPYTPKRAKPDCTVDECSNPTNLEAKNAIEEIKVRTEEESHIYYHNLGLNKNKNKQWYNVIIWGRVFDDGIRAVSKKLRVNQYNKAKMEDKATAA